MGKRHAIAIVADGSFPTAALPLKFLSEAEIVIACDGAVESLAAAGYKADYIVGDMDTLPADKQQEYKEKIVRIAEQESNDLTKAFRFALGLFPFTPPENADKKVWPNKGVVTYVSETDLDTIDITILGATGKREDHTIGNISLLADYVEQARKCPWLKISIQAYTDYGVFVPYYPQESNLSVHLFGMKGSAVSIFAFDPKLTITSQGLEYQTSGVTFDRWWKATLNRIAEENALLTLSHSAPIILYFPY